MVATSKSKFILILSSLLWSCSFVMNAGLIKVKGEEVWSYSPQDVAASYGELGHGSEYKTYSIITKNDGTKLLIPKLRSVQILANRCY